MQQVISRTRGGALLAVLVGAGAAPHLVLQQTHVTAELVYTRQVGCWLCQLMSATLSVLASWRPDSFACTHLSHDVRS